MHAVPVPVRTLRAASRRAVRVQVEGYAELWPVLGLGLGLRRGLELRLGL